MKGRAIYWAAAALGIAGIVAMRVYSRGVDRLGPRIVGRMILAAKGDQPSHLQIEVEPSRELKSLGAAGETWEYRVTDASRRVYLARPNSDEGTHRLWVPLAYGRPAKDPRIETLTFDGRVGSTRLGSLPAPDVRPMLARPSHEIRAYHVSTSPTGIVVGDGNDWEGVRFASVRPLASDEGWKVNVLETPLQRRTDVVASLGKASPEDPRSAPGVANSPSGLPGPSSSHPNDGSTQLLYGSDVTATRVKVIRTAYRTQTERISISSLRTSRTKKGGILVWDGSPIRNALGLVIRFVPNRGTLEVVASPLYGALGAKGQLESVVLIPENEKQVLSTWIESKKRQFLFPGYPIREGPFIFRATLIKRWTEPLGSFEATIPVEPASAR